ncbi:MAG: TraR/DksA family transcriptional regulator [Sphingobacteriales bacterium]|jgi:RNA polymerase-binding transcription factor DksA
MATKKNAKAAPKPVKAAKKAPKAPEKKAAPAKKVAAAKPVKKAVKAAKPLAKAAPVAKKKAPAPAKPAPAKKAAPVKPAAKAPVKPAPKAPVKAAPAKPVAKAPAKPVAKAAPAKPMPAAKLPVKPAPVVKAEPAPPKPPAIPLLEVKPVVKPKPVKKDPPKPVAMPKINATSSRKYEPEFTKSVLDQPSPIMNGPSLRYSDAELQEFRELISKKLEAAKKELSYLHGLITRKDEMSGDEQDNRYMTMEDGSLSMEREQLSQMASRQIDFIDKLEKALIRIENKTYGICRVTGRLIDKARLRAVPHATLSIEAKMGIAKNPNIQ